MKQFTFTSSSLIELNWVGYQWGEGVGRMGGKVQGIRSINDKYKIDRGTLRIV